MKIRFLTASAEPGKDGIGDYTLRLASECEARGHAVEIIAVHDRYAAEIISEKRLLRLPMATDWKARANAFFDWAHDRSPPDWGSLQLAPYALHKRGFVHGWADRLRGYSGARRLQAMIHETWISQSPGEPLRYRFIGALQRVLLKGLLRELKPGPLHTSNDAYAQILAREGFHVTRLPMFGAIPFALDTDGRTEKILLEKLSQGDRTGVWIAGIFGTLHPVWPPEPLLSRMQELARANGKRLCLVSLGRIGSGQELWNELAGKYAGIRFLQIGERPAPEMSRYLQQLDFGIATTPYGILGKSSSVAALREHGLPVIVNRMDVPEPEKLPEGLITPGALDRLPAARLGVRATAEAVVDQFLASLTA